MRVSLAAAFVCLSSLVVAQSAPPADWRKARDIIVTAVFSADVQTWSQYVADDFMVVNPDGSTRTKAQRIAEIKAAKPVAVPPTPADQQVRVYGDTVIETFSAAPDNGPRVRVTAVYVKQAGQWKGVSTQFTPLSASK